jgi:PAS domain S-box-containing protein
VAESISRGDWPEISSGSGTAEVNALRRAIRAREATVEDQRRRLHAVLETAVNGVLTIDESGPIESMNPAACRIFGYDLEEVLGQNVKVLMPSPYHEEHDGYIANHIETGEARISASVERSKDCARTVVGFL